MDIILTRKEEIMTIWGKFQLIYELLLSHFSREEGAGEYFGICIKQYRDEGRCLVDREEAPGITESLEEARYLFTLFARETVMPVHLCEIIDDWQSAFYTKPVPL